MSECHRRIAGLVSAFFFVAVLLTCAGGCTRPPASGRPAADRQPPGSAEMAAVMASVFEWQLERLEPPSDPGWIQSTFMIGVVAAYEATGEGRYLDAALAWAERNEWRLGPRVDHADDQGAAQVYLALSRISDDSTMILPTRTSMDALIELPATGRELWWWCDALFMTPPALASLSVATGDERYLDAMDAWWWDTTEFLLDSEEHLFHRDEKAKPRGGGETPRSVWGHKLFWSRGNAWVLAGIARVLQYLPEDHHSRGEYLRLYTEMAAQIAAHQREDGLWASSLLDPRDSLPPETSGSALFCYALAWGINEGILQREAYLPVVRMAWSGLAAAVSEDGALGWVQPPGRLPALSFPDGTAPYGAGALLLAGSEMLRLE